MRRWGRDEEGQGDDEGKEGGGQRGGDSWMGGGSLLSTLLGHCG